MSDRRRHDDESPSLPSSELRGAVNLGLFIYLFVLGVAFLYSTRAVSDLAANLRDVPGIRHAIDFLSLGPYNYQLTYTLPYDTDHVAELILNWRDDMSDDEIQSAERLMLHEERSVYPHLRRRRYQMMASVANTPGGEMQDALPEAISQHLLTTAGIDSGLHRFRLRRQMLRPMDDNGTSDDSFDPYAPDRYQVVYEANVTLFRGRAQLTGVSDERDTAPVVPGRERREREAPPDAAAADGSTNASPPNGSNATGGRP